MLSVNFLKVLLYLLMRISLLMGHFSVRITVAFSLFLTCYTRIDWQLQALTWTVETLTIEVTTFTETSVNADDLVPYPVFGIGTRLRTGWSGVRPPVRAKGYFSPPKSPFTYTWRRESPFFIVLLFECGQCGHLNTRVLALERIAREKKKKLNFLFHNLILLFKY